MVAKDVRVSVTPVDGVALTAFRSGGRTSTSAAAAATTDTTTAAAMPAMPTGKPGAVGSAAPASASAAVDIPTATPPPATTTTVFKDMFAEESRDVLLELQLPKNSKAAVHNPMQLTDGFALYEQKANIVGDEEEVDVADVVLEYTDVSSGLQQRESAVLRVQRRPGGRGPGVLPAEVVFVTALRFETIDAIEEAQRLAGQGGGGGRGARAQPAGHAHGQAAWLGRALGAGGGAGGADAQRQAQHHAAIPGTPLACQAPIAVYYVHMSTYPDCPPLHVVAL